ncbi:MAG: hypothetical protein EOO39_44775, partial [Cytophagaceae bacterium]
MLEKPPLLVSPKDTLICINDRLQLTAVGPSPTTTFSWTPLQQIQGAGTANPIVSPIVTTRYYVDMNDDGCFNRDSVNVRVVDRVTLVAGRDTVICTGDTVRLRIQSDGLKYEWSPAAQVLQPGVQSPLVVTALTTPYTVIARIGGCSTQAQIVVTAIPYPAVNAGNDTVICYQSTAQLVGRTTGSSWQWTPAGSLTNASSLFPVARPGQTTSYILTAFDLTSGCPKPSADTVKVTVLPKIIPGAGRDTAVVVQQPLQLLATGGISYLWEPAFNLSDPFIANPLAIYNDPSTGIKYKVVMRNEAGCADSAYITVKVFETLPSVFVPTGFTPNNDGRNDRLIAIPVGMKQIEFFSVYNRWGQLVF